MTKKSREEMIVWNKSSHNNLSKPQVEILFFESKRLKSKK